MTTSATEPSSRAASEAPRTRSALVLDWFGTLARIVLGGVLLVAGLMILAGYLAWRPRSALAVDHRPPDQTNAEGSSWPAR